MARERALSLQDMVEVGAGGTHQARYEREIIWDSISSRLNELDIGNSSLVFGRLDWAEQFGGDRFYVGRVAVWDENQEPVTIDWRAPAAEAFYRATLSDPMGLKLRRHFVTRGRELLGLEDEYFDRANNNGHLTLVGEATLRAGLEAARTGRLADAAATIQVEQDAIIRSPLPGVLVVQGGPGTGKTVAALHRAAYLLYTHRFPLEGQGMLVLGPNRLFLTYIEQVLPSLGEAGVEVSLLADLLPNIRVRGFEKPSVARVKGDLRMVGMLRRARRDRQRALRSDLLVGLGLKRLRLTVDESSEIIQAARKRFRTHNGARRFVENQVYEHLAHSAVRSGSSAFDSQTVREQLHHTHALRETFEWMWPVLTPAHFLHDLFGSKALLRSAAGSALTAAEVNLLYRPRSAHALDVVWKAEDAPLLDEALALLGPRPNYKQEDSIRTYGHIVLDEAQDLSPMQLQMIGRRSLNGSMTVVGDIAQATSAWGHDSWDSLVEMLPIRAEPRFEELTIGYRLAEPIMNMAARVLDAAVPGLKPPRSVRTDGILPRFVAVQANDDLPNEGSAYSALAQAVLGEVVAELAQLGSGNMAVICHMQQADNISAALHASGVEHGLVYERGLESQVTVVPVELVKGLEVDTAVVVEPADICEKLPRGMQSLYVAITRATQRLVVVYARQLPEPLCI
ncbi:MAG: AAA family ATPase [Acidimicrobiia bacterium]|nr:AAA family ATPase [Acidimicrobiia bacterium]MYC57771.1 AAA family ATPase [Acidimicrobiia bacterium]MYI31320.1 AAA family ATPase [Acidimicrobiia bacterium]